MAQAQVRIVAEAKADFTNYNNLVADQVNQHTIFLCYLLCHDADDLCLFVSMIFHVRPINLAG